MSRRAELLALFLADACALGLAWIAFRVASAHWGWMAALDAGWPVVLRGGVLATGWVLLFAFAGLYADWHARGRFDAAGFSITRAPGFKPFC